MERSSAPSPCRARDSRERTVASPPTTHAPCFRRPARRAWGMPHMEPHGAHCLTTFYCSIRARGRRPPRTPRAFARAVPPCRRRQPKVWQILFQIDVQVSPAFLTCPITSERVLPSSTFDACRLNTRAPPSRPRSAALNVAFPSLFSPTTTTRLENARAGWRPRMLRRARCRQLFRARLRASDAKRASAPLRAAPAGAQRARAASRRQSARAAPKTHRAAGAPGWRK